MNFTTFEIINDGSITGIFFLSIDTPFFRRSFFHVMQYEDEPVEVSLFFWPARWDVWASILILLNLILISLL